MTQRRLLLILFAGGIVVAAPFLAGLTHDREVSPASIMATLTEARQTLDERKSQLRALDSQPAEPARRAQDALRLLKSAREVRDLTKQFLAVARTHYPHLTLFLRNVDDRLDADFADIDRMYSRIASQAPGDLHDASGTSHDTAAIPAQISSSQARVAAKAAPYITSSDPSHRSTNAEVGADSVQPPESTSALRRRYQRAYQLYVRGSSAELDEAILAFKEILATHQSFHLARYWLTKALVERQRFTEAHQEASRLVSEQPHLKVAREMLAAIETQAPETCSAPSPIAPPAAPSPQAPATAVVPASPPDMDPGLAALVAAPENVSEGAHPALGPARPASGPALTRPVGIVLESDKLEEQHGALRGASIFYEEIRPDRQGRTLVAWHHVPDVDVGPVRGIDAALLTVAKAWGITVIHCGAHPTGLADDGACIDGAGGAKGFTPSHSGALRSDLRTNPSAALAAAPPLAPGAKGIGQWPSIERLENAPEPHGRSHRIRISGLEGGAVDFHYDASSGRYRRSPAGAPRPTTGRHHSDSGDGPPEVASLIVLTHAGPGRRPCKVFIAGSSQEANLDWALSTPVLDNLGQPLALPPGPIWIVDPQGGASDPAASAANADAHE